MLFQLVARRLPDTSVAEAKGLVRAGAVYMGHLRVRVPTVRVATGERITVYPEAKAIEPLPDEALVVVHRADDFVVLDKPAGVAVAQTKASARGTLAEALRRRLERDGVLRPYVGVVHRLDQRASGLVLFTVRSIANKSLHRQFSEHRIGRTYRLRVHGDPPAEAFACEAALLEARGGRVKVATDGQGRAAKTEFRRLEATQAGPGTLLEATLHTGRTHQIRVHAAHLGLPLLGDRKYGEADDDADRMHLHAHRLQFEHPISGEPVDVTSTLPDWAQTDDDPPPRS